MQWRKIHPLFGAELTGVDAAGGLDAAQGAEILQSLFEFGVLVLPLQRLDDVGLARFAGSLGKIHALGSKTALSSDVVYALTNLGSDGEIVQSDNHFMKINVGNQLWHTDSTYLKPRSTVSILHGRVIPPVGADTQFCDTRVAYERLAPSARKPLLGKIAWHSLTYSRKKCGFTDWTAEELAALQCIPRPLVQHHLDSGRTSLCLAAHIGRVDDMDDAAAMDLVDGLIEQATKPDLVYTHHWRVNDLLLWDNRCTMHRAIPFDQKKYGRDLRTIRLVDAADV